MQPCQLPGHAVQQPLRPIPRGAVRANPNQCGVLILCQIQLILGDQRINLRR